MNSSPRKISTGLRNIKLVLEYDGSAFFGFQKQTSRVSVQQVLEKALSKLLNQPVKITAASGRTDSGVHASYQVANFKTDSKLSLNRIREGLNALLPPEAAVKSVVRVPLAFNARYSAIKKAYEYRIWNDRVRSPLRARQTCHVPYRLDVAQMNKAAAYLEGKHDFRSFCAADPSGARKENTVRTLYKIRVYRKNHLIRIRVEGDGFLYRMVRNLAGTLVEVGAGKRRPADMKALLRAQNRHKAGITMPAQGLTLVRVSY